MRLLFVFAGLILLCLSPLAQSCFAGVDIGLSADQDGIKSFYLAIGEHYNVPEKQVCVVRERNVPNEELPVVFFIAKRAGVTPEAVLKLRLGGKSWMDISLHFGFDAGAFYVPLKADPGPPYGNAWGHYKHRNRNEWGKIRLGDADVVNLVNLKFISERYNCSPDDVVKMRGKGQSFMDINTTVKQNKGQSKKTEEKLASDNASSDKQSKSKGKSKNK